MKNLQEQKTKIITVDITKAEYEALNKKLNREENTITSKLRADLKGILNLSKRQIRKIPVPVEALVVEGEMKQIGIAFRKDYDLDAYNKLIQLKEDLGVTYRVLYFISKEILKNKKTKDK